MSDSKQVLCQGPEGVKRETQCLALRGTRLEGEISSPQMPYSVPLL